MSNCATCGRPRTGPERLCAGCGAQFSDAPDTPAQAAAQPPGPEPTRWDTSWYRPDPGPAGPAMPGPAAGPGASGWGPVPAGPGTSGPQPPPSPRRSRSGLLIALLIVLVLAVGGGAFALVSAVTGNGKNNAQPKPASASPAASTGTTTPTASPTADASATGPAGASVVAVSSAAAQNPASPKVQALLERYFHAINTHNYQEWSGLLDAQMQEPESSFATGYATTQDTAETLSSLTETGGGGLAATVSFTSHQNPADSIYHMSCTVWTITLYLQPSYGQSSATGGYLIGSPPPGYQPAHQSCP